MITLLLFITSTLLLALLSLGSYLLYKKAKETAPLFLQKERLKEEIQSLDNTITERKNILSQLLIEEKNAQNTIAEGKIVKDFLNKYDAEYANKKSTLVELSNDIKDLTNQLNKDKQGLLDLQQNISQKSEELQKIGKELVDSNTQLSINEIKQKSLEAEIKKGNSLLTSLSEKISEKNNELAELISKIKLEQTTRELENKKTDAIKTEIQKLEKERDHLTSKQGKLEERIEVLSQKEVELKGVINSNSEYQRELASKSQWVDLELPYIKDKKAPKEIKEQDFLEEFKRKLSDNGIIFDNRIIDAFHTSLKVEDLSPMVVLAGISGTGKSLLPRLYANAIGMNFLQIAVQPRWDGPQDLFGFYNYMEHKFKATELSRMLWQYDIYNNEKNVRNQFSSEKELPMNLVLLDEMNLAKVEYYFSDMLSKLEAKRGVDVKKQENRLPAEIEFECSAQSNNANPRRLFINNNTLFVGTMNEDESTQSLSDKVMDRANVMRFGRPKDLDRNPKYKDLSGEKSFYISFENWEKWKKTSGKDANSVSEKLKQIVDPINDELEKIGRPFAHRVWQAMKMYVINYPTSSKEMAIADQIEMKILPKLNGLEKDDKTVKDALAEIGKQIEKLKDENLIKAFETARDANTPFFQWRGIPR